MDENSGYHAAVTAVTHDRARRSLLGAIVGALHSRSRARTGRPSRLAAAVQEHAMTFGALAAVDYGVFHLSVTAGWIAVGVSLFLADFKIQG